MIFGNTRTPRMNSTVAKRPGNGFAVPWSVPRMSARPSPIAFKPGAKHKSLIAWSDPSRQAEILDWNHRARDFGLAVDEREDTAEGVPYEIEPRQLLEQGEPEAFAELPIRRRDDFENADEEFENADEEKPLQAGVSREDVDLVRVYLRHIGKRKLLKRHQEEEIGERIEKAQRNLLAA